MSQFGRQLKLRAGPPGARGREWTDLHMSLTVSAGDGTQPNRLQARVYNLSDDSAGFLQQKGLLAEFFAGYDTPLLIGTGDITRIETTWEGPDRITTLECADGSRAHNSRVSMSKAGDLSVKGIIKDLAGEMGFKDVNLDMLDDVELPGGFAHIGQGRDALDGLTKSAGADWHIERGGLVVLPKGKPGHDKALLLRADTGLVGSPQRTDTGIKITCLLNPRVTTRRVVRVESREVKGFYMVKSYTHTAENAGDAWHTDIEAVRYDG